MQLGGNGYAFLGGYGTKGCYSYKSGSYYNMAFYGTGGTVDQMKLVLDSPYYRPMGYDCEVLKGILILLERCELRIIFF